MTPSLIDSEIQLQLAWKSHVQTDGSDIGGVPPESYATLLSPAGSPTGRLFYAQGSTVKGGYADVEFYTSRPVLPNSGRLQLTYTLTVDQNSTVFAQSIETDSIICIPDDKGVIWNYDGSLMIDVSKGGQVNVDKAGGGWVPTGIVLGSIMPDVPHEVVVSYLIDTTNKVLSVIGYQFDSKFYAVTTAGQKLPAVAKEWAEGVLFQVQLGLTAAAGWFSIILDHANYDWA